MIGNYSLSGYSCTSKTDANFKKSLKLFEKIMTIHAVAVLVNKIKKLFYRFYTHFNLKKSLEDGAEINYS